MFSLDDRSVYKYVSKYLDGQSFHNLIIYDPELLNCEMLYYKRANISNICTSTSLTDFNIHHDNTSFTAPANIAKPLAVNYLRCKFFINEADSLTEHKHIIHIIYYR